MLFLGQLHVEAGERKEALAVLNRGVELLEAAYAKTPTDTVTRVKLRSARLLRGTVLSQLGRGVEALADLARSKELEPPP
jgi:hypothetical protein